MSDPGIQDLLQLRNNPDHINWFAVGEALLLLSDGLRKYAENKMKEFHVLINKKVGGPCLCKLPLGKKRNPHGQEKTTCLWAQELKKFHVFSQKGSIPWHQSDSSMWHDPVHGYWEIAKLFMSDLGKNRAATKDPSTTDSGPLINLFRFCKHFKIQPATLDAVRDWRNKWAHAPDHKLSEKDKKDAFTDITCLMNDPNLVGIKEVQDCKQAIKETESADISILRNNELKMIQECRHIQEYQSYDELKEKMEEAIEEIRGMKNKLADPIDKMGSFFLTILLLAISLLLHNTSRMLWSLMVLYMFSQVGERSLILDDDCPAALMKPSITHLQLQEFDFSSYLAYKREGFVGRKWFFSELESIFEDNQAIAGVLITGDPGSGKSALMSQLICSRYSSRLIHNNTIGYHLCEHSEKGKRDGARFVRNLVDQIAARIEEYSIYVGKNEQIRIELDTRCSKDPTSCFFSTIVGPLRKLKQPDGMRFIVIDALDECFEGDMKTSEIMDILRSKLLHFPKWLKVILTSRNMTSVASVFPQGQISRMPLFATDERNVDDIRFYVSRFISQNTDFSHRLMTAVNIGSKRANVKTFLNRVITQTEGNFLFVKMTLQYMNDTGKTVDFHSLPTTLFGFYDSFFKRQFGDDRFGPFRSIFEVLLALYSPLLSQDVEEILESQYQAEDISKIIERMSCFLRFGRDGTIRIYHQSFADWLKNQTTVLALNKTRGHQSIAKFLLHRLRERNVDITFKELTELFMHILSGWSGQAYEMQETAMNHFNITEMRQSQNNQSILHYLATQPMIYLPVLDFFLPKFQTVDQLDSNDKTPAFYAASQGFVSSLQSCVNNGADISSFMKGYTEIDSVSVVVSNAGIEEFSLMHAAAAKGHADVVELLIKSNVSIPDTTSYPTPLQLAAGNGHLEVVELFYNHNVTFDIITLHHAAARNHLSVVTFLLHTVGLRDTCLPCQSSKKTTIQEAHTYFCETALHAAVSRGLDDIVKVLLSYGKKSLQCKHHSGKTVLIDASEKNNTEMVNLLLRHGADVTAECGLRTWRNSDICSLHSMFKQNFLYTVYCREDNCPSGYSAIHISAKYGLWKVAKRLASGRIEEMLLSANTDEHIPVEIAIAYDQKDFLQNVNISLQTVRKYLVGSIMVQFAVEYCSPNVAKLFLNEPLDDKDKKLWDLLLYTIRWSPCSDFKSNAHSESHCLKAFEETDLSEAEKNKKESEGA